MLDNTRIGMVDRSSMNEKQVAINAMNVTTVGTDEFSMWLQDQVLQTPMHDTASDLKVYSGTHAFLTGLWIELDRYVRQLKSNSGASSDVSYATWKRNAIEAALRTIKLKWDTISRIYTIESKSV